MRAVLTRKNRFSLAVGLALVTLTLTSTAPAATAEYCALAKEQASVRSSVLGAPEAFTSLGDPVTGRNTATVGVRKSFSGARQAETIERLALAQCRVYELEQALAEQAGRVEQRADLVAARALLTALGPAFVEAHANLQREEALLAARAGTLATVQGAFAQAEAVEHLMAEAHKAEVRLQAERPDSEESLPAIVSAVMDARAEVEALQARQASQSAWDVTMSGGARSDFGTHRTGAFVALTASRSFGKSAADSSAARVPELSTQLQTAERTGPYQTLARARDVARGLVAAERMLLHSAERKFAAVQGMQARVAELRTDDGLRMARSLRVEGLIAQARLEAAQDKVAYLEAWLERNR